jgi:sugar lactone lactonase YvrE
LHADEARTLELQLGYSDYAEVFLDGRPVFVGNSAYRSRDPSFAGIVGLFDQMMLPLSRGDHELMLRITESFGGWAFICRDPSVIWRSPGVAVAWSTDRIFNMPESVLWDAERKLLYVSNYDGYRPSRGGGMQSLAKLDLDGAVLDPSWVTGLANPTGMALAGDRLWVAVRSGLAEIDPDSGEVVARHPLPVVGFPNDVTAAPDGAIYLSDSRNGGVWRFVGGEFEHWLQGEEMAGANGLHLMGDTLYVGVNGDAKIRAADLESGELKVVAALPPGIIDGLESDADGHLLATHNEGRLYRVTTSGEVVKLFDTTGPGTSLADFASIPSRGLVVIPTFRDHRVIAVRISEGRSRRER